MTGLKRSIPIFFGLHARPGMVFGRILGLLPVAVLVGLYMYVSHVRHLVNPDDKLMPSLRQMSDAMKNIITVPDKRSGKNLFVEDTKASLKRLGMGIGIAAVVVIALGAHFVGRHEAELSAKAERALPGPLKLR